MAEVTAQTSPLVVVSNRGPLAFRNNPDGSQSPTRAGGGLVASLAPAITGTDTIWVSAATTEADRSAAEKGLIDAHGLRSCQLAIKPDVYRQYYEVIANGTLWFLHHNLFDLARRPRIDRYWWDAWHTYCDVNEMFARFVADTAPEDAIVLIQDYHLTMLGHTLRIERPDLKTVHFHHTPFAGRTTITTLPQAVVERLIDGLAAHHACGFHLRAWSENFALCCADIIGRVPPTFISAAAPDIDGLREVAQDPKTREAVRELNELAGDRKLLVRVDRMELSKNLLRGFQAFDDLLRRFPEWREKIVFVAQLYPSREGLAEYLAYRNEVEGLVDQINDEWRTDSWLPIVLNVEDNFIKSVAAFLRYDVLMVNPIRDGLNLVAKEGALLNEREGAILLSREAGSWGELSDSAIGINPFDITGTSDAIVHALKMSGEERTARAASARAAASRRTPSDWLADQIKAAVES